MSVRAQILRKMAATVDTVPYDMLVEFGYNYDETLMVALLLREMLNDDVPDYADAHELMLTLLDELRSINLDHPDAQEAIDVFNKFLGRPNRTRLPIGRTRAAVAAACIRQVRFGPATPGPVAIVKMPAGMFMQRQNVIAKCA